MEKQPKSNKTNDGFLHLKQFSKFKSVAEMDEAVKQHIYAHYNKLTETDKAVLDCLARHSLKYYGVSNLLSTSILKEINKTSTKTVTRSTNKLAMLKIIEVHKTKKTKSNKTQNLRGANIFAILPFELSSDGQNCPSGNVSTNVSQRNNNEKPQYDKAQSNNFKQESFKSLISNSLKSNTLKNTYADVSSKEKRRLYAALEQMYKSYPDNLNNDFTQFIMIIGGSYNKYVQEIGLQPLETLLTSAMAKVLKSTNAKSDFKLYSHLVKKGIEELIELQKAPINLHTVIQNQHKYKSVPTRTELVPDWFNNRNEVKNINLSDQEQLDFELAKKQLLEKHAELFKVK